MTTYVVYAGTADGYLLSQHATYSSARAGGTVTATTTTSLVVGQDKYTTIGTIYKLYESFIRFDLPSPMTFEPWEKATGSLRLVGNALSTATIEARVSDWGTALTSSDWVAGSAISALPLLGTATWTTLSSTYAQTMTSTTLDTYLVAGTSIPILLTDVQLTGGTAPTADLTFLTISSSETAGLTSDPRLTISGGPKQSGLQLYVGSTDVTQQTALDAVRVTDTGRDAVGSLNARVWNPTAAAVTSAGAKVVLYDGDQAAIAWQGRITGRQFRPRYAVGNDIDVEAASIAAELDRAFISAGTVAALTTDQDAVVSLVSTYGSAHGLTATTSTVEITKVVPYDIVLDGKTLREGIQAVADNAVGQSTAVGWVPRSLGNPGQYAGVAYGASKWVAVSSTTAGTVLTSPDAATWTASNTALRCSSLAFGSGLFVAGATSAPSMYFSTNGTAWSTASLGTGIGNPLVRGVAYGSAGWVATATDTIGGTAYIFQSTSGTASWTKVYTGSGASLYRAAYAAGTYVVAGSMGVLYSTSGTAWSTAAASTAFVTTMNGIAANGSTVVVVGNSSGGTNYIYYATSPAGTYTRASVSGTVTNFDDVVWSSDYATWVATAPDCTFLSTNGTAWTQGPSAVSIPYSIAAADAKIVIGAKGTALVSSVEDTLSRSFYVGPDGGVRYFLTATTSAPYAISDAPSGTASIAAEEISLEYDESQIVNRVFVASAPADWLYGAWVEDATSVAAYGPRDGFLADANVVDAATAEQYGRAYLASRKDPIARGRFTVTNKNGWASGQTVTITNAALGLSAASYTITEVTTEFLTGTGIRRYRVSFGGLPKSLVRAIAADE